MDDGILNAKTTHSLRTCRRPEKLKTALMVLVVFVSLGTAFFFVALVQLPMSASTPDFFLTQIVCRDSSKKYCDPSENLITESIEEVNCLGPTFADRACTRSQTKLVEMTTVSFKEDFPARTAMKFDARILGNDLRRSLTNITLLHSFIASMLIVMTYLVLSRMSRAVYLIVLLISWMSQEHLQLMGSIAPIGLSSVSMFAVLILLKQLIDERKSKQIIILTLAILVVHAWNIAIRRPDQSEILIVASFGIVLSGLATRVYSKIAQKIHRPFHATGLVGLALISFVSVGGTTNFGTVSNVLRAIIPKTLVSPSLGTRLNTEVGTNSVWNTLIEFVKSPIYYAINIGHSLLDVWFHEWPKGNQMFPFLSGLAVVVVVVVFFGLVGLRQISFPDWIDVVALSSVIMMATLKGNLDAGTRSNLRYVFVLVQMVMFVLLKNQLSRNSQKQILNICVFILFILLYHAIGTWLYLRSASMVDFGYFHLSGWTTAVLTSGSLILAGTSVAALSLSCLENVASDRLTV